MAFVCLPTSSSSRHPTGSRQLMWSDWAVLTGEKELRDLCLTRFLPGNLQSDASFKLLSSSAGRILVPPSRAPSAPSHSLLTGIQTSTPLMLLATSAAPVCRIKSFLLCNKHSAACVCCGRRVPSDEHLLLLDLTALSLTCASSSSPIRHKRVSAG